MLDRQLTTQRLLAGLGNRSREIDPGHVVDVVDAALDQLAASAHATPPLDELSVTAGIIEGGRRYTVTIAVRS